MKVFVYGTLVHPETRHHVVPGIPVIGHAVAHGWEVVSDRGLPTLEPGEGDVDGWVLEANEEHLRALDYYEGVDVGLYARVPVKVDCPAIAEEPTEVQVYIMLKRRLEKPPRTAGALW